MKQMRSVTFVIRNQLISIIDLPCSMFMSVRIFALLVMRIGSLKGTLLAQHLLRNEMLSVFFVHWMQ